MSPGDVSPPSTSHGEIRTFLFADIRGYTRFTVDHGDEAAVQLVSRFAELSEEIIAASVGKIISYRGDEVLAVFVSARQALWTAIELQHRFVEASSEDLPLKVGVGLDAGEAVPVEGTYLGTALNLAARLCSLAAAGEVLASETVAGIASTLEGLEYIDRGQVQLKGFVKPVRVLQVVPEGAQTVPTVASVSSERVSITQQLPIGGFLGALPSGPLVGRDDEVRQLSEAVGAAAEGRGRLILLAGEAGAGKTRLAQEATRELRNRGFLIAAGSCFEHQQAVPYYPFLDVLTTLYGLVSPGLRAQTGHDWPQLGRLLPGAGLPVPARSDGTEEQEWLRRAVVGFVQAAAKETPIGVLLDDLHWADEASLDLLQRLARQVRGDRILLLGTYRDAEVRQNGGGPLLRGSALQRTLRDLHRVGLLECIVVRRLSEDGTRALMAASLEAEVPEDFAHFIYGQTEGNALFTQEVLHALVERGEVQRRNDHWEWREVDEIVVPETVRSVIGERLLRLDEKTQELLAAASVLGQTFRFDELQALGNYAEEDLERSIEEALRSGIIRENRDQYSFDHTLIHGMLYATLSARRKRRLHLAAGEALERLPEPRRVGREAELARHFLEGEDRKRALQYSLLAGDRAQVVFAHSEAAQHYRRAQDLARELGDDIRLGEALRKLGGVLSLSGRYDAAEPALEEAVQLGRQANDLDGEIEAVTSLLRHAPERGQHRDAARWVEPLLQRLEGHPVSPQKLAFFSAYAYFLVQTLELDKGLQIAQQAVDMAGTLGDEYELARAKVTLGHLLLWHGRAGETTTLLSPVIPALEDAGDLPNAMRAASLLAQDSWFAGDLQAAMRWRERSLRLARRVGDAAQEVYETCMLGYQHMRLGDMDLAWEEGLRAVAAAREMDRSTMPGAPLGLLATLSWMQGKKDDLERYTDEMISLSDHSDEPNWRRHGELILTQRDLLAGRPDQALARLEPVVLGVQLDILEQALELPVLAEAYLRGGNVQRAREMLEAALALRGRGMTGLLTDALRVHAMVLLSAGESTAAEAVLQELLEITRSMPFPFAEALALVEYAHLETSRNDAKAARERLEEALTIFRRLGAEPFVDLTSRKLGQVA